MEAERFDAAILPTQIEYSERIAFARDSRQLKRNFDFIMDRVRLRRRPQLNA